MRLRGQDRREQSHAEKWSYVVESSPTPPHHVHSWATFSRPVPLLEADIWHLRLDKWISTNGTERDLQRSRLNDLVQEEEQLVVPFCRLINAWRMSDDLHPHGASSRKEDFNGKVRKCQSCLIALFQSWMHVFLSAFALRFLAQHRNELARA